MGYGLRLTDASGNATIITPEVASIFDGGRTAMPSSGSDGNAYSTTIDITPNGEPAYDEADIGVLADEFIMNTDLRAYNLELSGDVPSNSTWYMKSWFFRDNFDFYERTESTGVLSTWTPDTSSTTAYDGVLSVFPLCFWDKRGGSTFSNVEIFAGSCYLGYDQSAGTGKTVYTVGSQGVENVDYLVHVKRYKGEE